VRDSWQRRIDRATTLANADGETKALLTQYAQILRVQQTCFDALAASGDSLTGSLSRDLAALRRHALRAFTAVREFLPPRVVADVPDADRILPALLTGWHSSSPAFLERLVLQPYAEALAMRDASGSSPRSTDAVDVREDRGLDTAAGRTACPFCGGPPQVSVLRHDSAGDGGGRALVCAMCATTWPLRRILCVNCGEEDDHRLQYFHADRFDHVRVDACESCRHYLKAVDLTRLGLAAPLVEEVASGALDVWARERGYTKVTPNLIGL
jgi:FdhE protein